MALDSCRRADGFVFVYDITNRASFEDARRWIREASAASPGAYRILVGNGCDRAGHRAVSEGAALAREHRIQFLEASAAAGTNVAEFFGRLALAMRAQADGAQAATTRVRLSARGLGRAARADDPAFTFVVGGAQACRPLQARFISARVCRLFTADATAARFVVGVDDADNRFADVMALLNGESVQIDHQNFDHLERFCRELECDEFARLGLAAEAVNPNNAVARLRAKRELGMDAEITFIASRFYDLDDRAIASLRVDELEAILGSAALKLDNEGSLFDTIVQLSGGDPEFGALFSYVRPEFLDRVFPEFLSGAVWSAIRGCFGALLDAATAAGPRAFAMHEGRPFRGVLTHLGAQCGRNVHTRWAVSVTSLNKGADDCHRITDPGGAEWHTANGWLCFDFKDRAAHVAAYTLKAGGPGTGHPRHWEVEGSNNGRT